ncbi:MAG: heme-dependent peroxidase [Planctomycetes bacterium]|nr:heme-dependent peroxidase [Planctomycetota bacterium]
MASDSPSLTPLEGWHVLHLYYRLRRGVLHGFSAQQRAAAREEWLKLLDASGPGAPPRLQTFAVMGQKADFGLLLMGPHPLQLDRMQQQLQAGVLGAALEPAYSFVSLTEVSEYVPTPEQYAQRLREEGQEPQSEAFAIKVKTYAAREEKMRAQRLYPEIPPWPCVCFYPMSKKREVGENWYSLPFEERMRLMTGHGKTGQTFAGKVVQLITTSTGLDDWEWGVTLWARNPQYLKEIVYTMRFDEASARYALFGSFYVGYVQTPAELLQHLQV